MKQEKYYFVYIICSSAKTLYIGVTNSLVRRLDEHRFFRNLESFSTKYKCNKLVYYEQFTDIRVAIAREK